MFRPLLIASLATVAFVGGFALLAAPGAEVRANTPATKNDRKASDVRVVFASQMPNAASNNGK